MLSTLFLLVFVGLMIAAAWRDLATMLIPNWISIVLVLAYVPAALAAGQSWSQIGAGMCFGAVVLLVCAALFYMSVMGGGDAKLISAASLWTGLAGAPEFLAVMALSGGLLALALLVLRGMKSAEPSQSWAKRLLSRGEGAPYAVAIAAGGLFAVPASPVLMSGLGGLGL